MAAITVERHLHIRQPDMQEEAMVTWAGYVSPTQPILMEAVAYGGQRGYYFTVRHLSFQGPRPQPPLLRRSLDNGRTWTAVGSWATATPVRGRWHLECDGPNLIYNPETGTMLCLERTNEAVAGLLPSDKGAPASTTGLLWTRLSRDGGLTWSDPEQLLCGGADADPIHWAPGICYGRNSGGIKGVEPVWLDRRRFLLPFFGTDDASPRRFRSACLIGTWRTDDSGVDWALSAYATVKPEYSSDGGDEPSVAVLPDGRWLMTMRVRARRGETLAIPSGKFIVTSSDQGRTRSEPAALRYSDGRQVYSPACLAHVFRAATNGRHETCGVPRTATATICGCRPEAGESGQGCLTMVGSSGVLQAGGRAGRGSSPELSPAAGRETRRYRRRQTAKPPWSRGRASRRRGRTSALRAVGPRPAAVSPSCRRAESYP